MADRMQVFDVLVIGGGNAALCAAMTARREGATVLLLESAPEPFRGGNSRHTRDIRYMHHSANGYVSGPYPEEECWEDLLRVTGGETNEQLAWLTIRGSSDLGDWMPRHGVRWQMPLRGTLHLARTNAFFLGGGKAMVNAYYETCRRLGVTVSYESEVAGINVEDGRFVSAVLRDGPHHEVTAKRVVLACGGFEANVPWLKKYWGEAADNFVIRGPKYNQGRLLADLLEHGA